MTERRLAPTIVVPCHDEAARLDVAALRAFAGAHPAVRFVLVDDGSRDRTLEVLRALEADDPARFTVLARPVNGGKAEAVRTGMLHALDRGGSDVVGFWDADLATPLDAVPEFLDVLARHPEVEVVIGARVKLLGRDVERSALRHYFGRVAATAASTLLRLPVYDTQCGAKLLRVVEGTRSLFAAPFVTRWAFDVEVLARWLGTHPGVPRSEVGRFVVEVPLRRWTDVPGSKVTLRDVVGTPRDLARIGWRYRRELGLGAAARRLEETWD